MKRGGIPKASPQATTYMGTISVVFICIFVVFCLVFGMYFLIAPRQTLVTIFDQFATQITVVFLVFSASALACIFIGRARASTTSNELAVLTHALPCGIRKCTSDDYKFQFISDGFLHMVGYTRDEIKELFDDSAINMVHPLDLARITEQLKKDSIFSVPFSMEYRIKAKNGKTLWVLDKVCLIHDETGAVIYYSVCLDNTAKKEADMQAHLHDEWFRIAMEHSTTRAFVYNLDTLAFDSMSSAADERPLLLPAHIESMPESLIDSGLVAPDTADELRAAFGAVAAGAATGACTVRLTAQSADGSDQWLSIGLTTVYDEYKRPTYAIAMLEDVSKSKLALQRYDDERRNYDTMLSFTVASFLFDVKSGIILSAYTPLHIDKLMEGCNFEEQLPYLTERAVFWEDRAEFLRTLSRRNLLELYGKGITTISHEYRGTPLEGTLCWREMTINLVDAPVSGSITAFLYLLDIDMHKRRELDLQHKAEHDPLTGLWNRRGLETQLEKFFKTAGALTSLHGFFILDMDDFKSINDTLGHIRGDDMLCAIADELRSIFRKTDIIARLAGDEFVVFMKNAGSHARIADKARSICHRLAAIDSDDPEVPTVHASIGIAIAPEAGTDFESLYAHADDAHYVAKRGGKNRYTFYKDTEEAH